MMGPSKILTVSYGTFSCTLEGFDDPFSTMRGIAEYFRDLAAEDRYFGAEPPTPDAEMLHKIAEREVQRRVEARVGDNSVVLRQLDGEDTPEEAEPASAVDAAPAVAAAAIAAAAQDSAQETTPEASAAPVVDEPADIAPLNEPTEVETESVAAKLARIRSVVSDDDGYQEDEHADEVFTSAPISAAFDDVEEAETAAQAEPAEADVEEEAGTFEEDTAEADDVMSTLVESAVAQDVAVEEDVSDTASAQAEGEEEPIEAPSEDLAEDHAEEAAARDAPQEDAVEDEMVAESDQDVSEQDTNEADEAEPGDDWDQAAVSDPDAPAIARVVKMRRRDFESAIETGSLEEFSEEMTVSFEVEETFEETVEKAADETVSEDDHVQPDVAQSAAPEEVADAEEESTLSPEDEAELMATLDEVQRKAEAEARAEKEGRALLENQDIEKSADTVSRILEVTDSEMEETDGTRRRSAIAHLKAAVAATRADKFLSKKRAEEDENELNQYREDLAKVVRPRRPSEGTKPKTRRTAPLVLVSEQRVDEAPQEPEVAADGAAVRPRRITSGNLALSDDDMVEGGDGAKENIFVEPESFAKFAAEMGAHDLPDLLEAAAAYTAFVEGREYFSRPQIMKAVADINEDEEYSREESLRSFGLLLRRGKIKKIKRGQFKIAETTRFKPQQLAAGE